MFNLGYLIGFGSFEKVQQGQLLWLLSIAIENDISLIDELEAFASTVPRRKQRHIYRLISDLKAGDSLSEALRSCPNLVPRPAVLAISVGEQTGTLQKTLRNVAVRHTKKMQPRSSELSLSWMATYFCLFILVFLLLVSFQMYFIIPKFEKIFSDFDTELPQVTVALINVSNIAVRYSPVILLLILAGIGFLIFLRMAYREKWLDWLNRWFPRYDTPDILRNLACAISAGSPLSVTLPVLSSCHHRTHMQQRIKRVELAIEAGIQPWRALCLEGLIRQSELAVLESAQRAENLPWALRTISETIEQRHSHLWNRRFEILRPSIVLIIGLLTAFICIGMFLPLIKLVNDLS